MLTKKTVNLCQSIRGFFFANHNRWEMFLVILAVVFLANPVQAIDIQSCKDCHEATLSHDNLRNYLHSPYIEDECEVCHVSSGDKVTSLSQVNWRKVQWLAKSPVNDINHAFLLPDDRLKDTLAVQLDRNRNTRKPSRHVISLPSRMDLSEVKDSGKPPTISNIQVLEVKRGVFISAIIGWETDILADASVRYSHEDFLATVIPSMRLGRKHQVVLSKLKPDRTYNFSAISSDLFGHSQVSEPLTFSTSEFFTAKQQSDNIKAPPEEGDENSFDFSFQKLGQDYLVEITSKQPAPIRIGTTGEPRCFPDDEYHIGLSCRQSSAIETCLNCHSIHDHPVNVLPRKKGIIIPPEFPTLHDGRLICISCHESHSSDNENLTRQDSKRGLCVDCHLTKEKKKKKKKR